ncbi:hypothetical protein C8A01DRAFT_49810 [Parachaetomium inaequale]|uniref:DUF6604 domain-containing protein n=1 Tax=Parachaetomium inaequale TaxID=2588326 RepID=A0AAN6SNE2_9PEZI|nr:hypothetical protein C8A01DRAFT_49810 [Parachaetomium inaequale]
MGTWRRYKLGQVQFTSWLKQTAEKLVTRKTEDEDEGGADSPKTEPQQSRRQKRKAKAGITFDAGAAKSVHWSQLELLAQRVADNATADDVPDAALNILRDVVSLRKKSFDFFSSAAKDTNDEKIKQSNASHAHIISVLERVLARLEALVKAAGSRKRRNQYTDTSQVATSDLSNMFAYLELQTAPDAAGDEAADESEEEAPTKGRPQKAGKKKGVKKTPKPKKPERQSETAVTKAKGDSSWVDQFRFGLPGEDGDEQDELDLYMMVYCFFADFNAIRNHVAERWCDYWYDRSVPLDTLAVITNAAFELFHQLEHDLVRELRPISPKLAGYDFMMGMLFYHFGIDHVDYDSYGDLTRDEEHERIWRDEADWLALPSHFTLQQTLRMIPPGKVPMLAPSHRSPTVYGANTLEEWKHFEGGVTNQIIIEGAHLKALKTNQQEPPVLPSESLLLLDFQNCLKRGDYTSSLIFSLHLWVDIRNIIETDHSKPFEEMQRTATKLKHALETHNPINYRTPFRSQKDHDFKRSWIARIREAKHYMVEDFLFEDKKARLRQSGVQEDPEPFFLLKHEPVWAGLLDFRAKLAYSQLGHEFVLLSLIVGAAACLYHAALAADPSLVQWEDMAKYVDTHADGDPFKAQLQAGEGAAAIILNFGELVKTEPHAVDDEGFTPAIAMRQSLYERYAFDNKRGPFVDYLGDLSAQRLQIERGKREDVHNALLGTSGSDAPSGKGDAASTALVKHSSGAAEVADTERDLQRKADLSRLSPVEMLHRLDETVTSQVEGLLTLDYFKLFDDSVAFLEALTVAFGPDMESRLREHDSEPPTHLQLLPLVLCHDLEDSQSPAEEAEIINTVVEGCRGTVMPGTL